MNLSLAGPPDPLLERLIRAALAQGTAIVTAYRRDASGVAFPGSVEGVLAVGSSAPALPDAPVAPPLAAPAEDILTAAPGGGFEFVSGSSFAAAFVSGILALLLERAPDLEVDRLHEVLRRTSRVLPGSGAAAPPLVDACAALDLIAPGGRCVSAAAGSPGAVER